MARVSAFLDWARAGGNPDAEWAITRGQARKLADELERLEQALALAESLLPILALGEYEQRRAALFGRGDEQVDAVAKGIEESWADGGQGA